MPLRYALLVLAALSLSGCTPATPSSETFAGVAPRLTTAPDDTVILSYLRPEDAGHSLVFRVFDGRAFGPATVVAAGDNWFVNWADFPSVLAVDETRWAAHWLVRQPAGGYAYDIALALSEDAGRSWSAPFLVHDDGTPTEHGFVTLFRDHGKLGAVWLDGRHMTGEHDPSTHGGAGGMTLRTATIDGHASLSGATEIDGLTCDCCQTDVAVTEDGPVVIYRDRTPDEIRDIYIARHIDGQWTPGQPVADDGWNIAGCPVNGPVIDAVGTSLAATWFTAAGNTPRVQTAWSDDSGESFGQPIEVSAESVVGYVGQVAISNDRVVVSWLCGGAGAPLDLCYRAVGSDGRTGAELRLGTAGTLARMSVPQVALVDERLLFVWTDKQDGELGIEHRLVPIPAF